MAAKTTLKKLQTAIDHLSVSEFMKLPRTARDALEELYEGILTVVPRKGQTIHPPAHAPEVPQPSERPEHEPGHVPVPGHVPRFPEIPGASLIPGAALPPRGAFESDPPAPERPEPGG